MGQYSGMWTLSQASQAVKNQTWPGIPPSVVEYLIVAGGGGASTSATSGGGGAGGLLAGYAGITPGTSYFVTVGAGGATAGTTGSLGANSVFIATSSAATTGNIVALGGGGGSQAIAGATSGGSGGGGGGGISDVSGAGTPGQGNAGGGGTTAAATPYPARGGGGAGTIGLNAAIGIASNGGAGIASNISGTVTVYAGGGGGGIYGAGTPGVGGVGGGGAGGNTAIGSAGTENTGGGGGGAGFLSGAAGGSGVVIIRYPGTTQFFTGGAVTYANGYVVHKFYVTGILAPTAPTVLATSDYQISRSLRFNSADSAYVARTPATATNRKTWTLSFWVKRAALGSQEYILFAGSDSNNRTGIRWNNDNLEFEGQSGGVSQIALATSAVFRDVSAWYHIVYVLDTTQATSSERAKIYVNGSQVTAFGAASYPSQNADLFVNSTNAHDFGRYSPSPSNYLNNYLTEINLIDGQALTPSSFGETNSNTGVWGPKAYTGTYGTNGFYLNFSDNSNTTAATLGKDYSGNGNNFTPNNFSVTAGIGNDSFVDTPTQYGTDTGVGGEVRGNYCTWNPLDKATTTTLANGNLDASYLVSSWSATRSTFGLSSGKWYWEVTPTTITVSMTIGIGKADALLTFVGASATSWGYYNATGVIYNNSVGTAYGASYAINNVIGVAFDADIGTLTFYKNGTSQGTAATGLTSGPYFPMVAHENAASSANFGQRPFAYTAPSGFKALCTQNLPAPTIGSSPTSLASKFFNTVLYTGDRTSRTISVGFQPDLVWVKSRSAVDDHYLMNAVVGTGKYLSSNLTAAEVTSAASLTAYTSDGFSIGNTGTTNETSRTYVAWNWKASNATAVTNTSGSLTSSVSANPTAGFSVVTFTKNATTNETIGHGLGVAPSMIIVKARQNAGYNNWAVFHISIGIGNYLELNTTVASTTSSTIWNNTLPTSTVFSMGTAWTSTVDTVAYCFASIEGYSKIGTYTGNGSADGPFVYTGFRPAFVMVKRSSSSGTKWQILDTKRSTYNVMADYLYAGATDAEAYDTTVGIDSLSNGFKIRGTDGNVNTSTATYIYMAFAENPFKYSLAR